jgi:flagellar hook-length control protein FliK
LRDSWIAAGRRKLRIVMQSDSLGGVELRARMTGDQVGAAIVVERHDIHSALSNELPALHAALVEKNVRVQTLSISQGTQTLLGGGSGTEMNGRGFERPRAKAQTAAQSGGISTEAGPLQEWSGPATVNGRLSVRA